MQNTETESLKSRLVRDIARDIVHQDAWDGDGWDYIEAYVTEHEDEYFEGVPESTIMKLFAPDDFRTLDWLDTVHYRNSEVVPALAHGAIREGVRSGLWSIEDDIEAACDVHDALEALTTQTGAPFVVDGAPNPSLLVVEFFSWLGERDSAGEDWACEANEILSFEQFNETHVRRLEPLDPTGGLSPSTREAVSPAQVLLDALINWLTDQHESYF